jgi:hypothetical protein
VKTFEDRGAKLILGRAHVESRITLDSERHVFAILHLGDHRLAGGVSADTDPEARAEMCAEVVRMFRAGDVDGAMRLILRACDRPIDSLDAVFRDAQRRFVLRLLDSTVAEVLGAQRTLYERYSPLLRRLAPVQSPIPRPLLVAGELVLGADLLHAAREVPPHVQTMRKLLDQAKEQHLHIDRPAITFALGQSVELLAERLVTRPEDPSSYGDLDRVIEFAERSGFALDLWRTQNLFYELVHSAYRDVCMQSEMGDAASRAVRTAFQGLANRLRVRLPAPR